MRLLPALALFSAILLGWLATLWFRPLPVFEVTFADDPKDFEVSARAQNGAARDWLRAQSPSTDWTKILAVQSELTGVPLFGSYSQASDELRFKPTIPPVPGARIKATFTAGACQWWIAQTLSEADSEAPQVLAIHPGASVLPENMIKFYIEFSEPMTQGDFFKHVTLINETKGQPVPGAFREVELWSPDGKRFTLWLHPGRQKTGVNLNEDEGPVLKQGDKYILSIADSLTARTGARLQEPARKSFTAGPHDGSIPDLKKWSLTHPRKGTREPLTIHLDKPLDWAMLATALSIQGVKGTATTANLDQKWTFIPDAAWVPGSYQLSVNQELEDLAGNSLLRPFESQAGAPSPSASVSFIEIKIEP